jgi:hypothetical protein
MDSITFSLVAASTLVWPFETRETVCEDTPACWATSAIDGRAALAAGLSVAVMLIAAPAAQSVRNVRSCGVMAGYANILAPAGQGAAPSRA